jgi:hypothetical protein
MELKEPQMAKLELKPAVAVQLQRLQKRPQGAESGTGQQQA